ncbi:MAG: hypothetical protein Q4E02_00485 [Lagierella massiliensis]|nr:hypothetical protein [Lagierella massiliensis]
MKRKNKEILSIVLAIFLAVSSFLFIIDDSTFYSLPKRKLSEDSVEFLMKYVPEDISDVRLVSEDFTNSSYLLVFETGETYTVVTYNKSLILPLYTRDSVFYNIENPNGYKVYQDNHINEITYTLNVNNDRVKIQKDIKKSNTLIYNVIYAGVSFLIILLGVYFSVKMKLKPEDSDNDL